MSTRNYLLGLILGAATLIGCSQDYMPTLGESVSRTINSGANSQAALVSCEVTRVSDGKLVMHLDSVGGSKGALIPNYPITGDSLRFDCSATTSVTGGLNYSVSIDGVPVSSNTTPIFTVPVPNTATSHPILLSVSDKLNIKADVSYALLVQCPTGSISIDPTKVAITPVKFNNYYKYDASSAVSGGTAGYAYSWDFNGDDNMDLQPVGTSFSNSSTSGIAQSEYNIYAGVRGVILSVRDLACNHTATVTINTNFQIPRIAPGGVALETPYFYVQADAKGINNTDKAANALLTADWFPADPVKHVICDYSHTSTTSSAGFSIGSNNNYGDGSDKAMDHGLGFTINNIADTGAVGEQIFNTTLANADYKTAGSGDTMSALDYSKVGSCPVTLHVKRAVAMVPCASDATAVMSEVVIIKGEFSCTDQQAITLGGAKKHLSLTNGYFFCQVSKTNQCPGGGQGGGGQPPIPH